MLLVGSEKGGVGKTTLAVQLALLRAQSGATVILVDTDRQASASHWIATRSQEGLNPQVACRQMRGAKIHEELKKLDSQFDDVVVDAGGDSVELRSAMLAATHVCIPIRASQIDVWTLEQMDDLVREASKLNPGLRASVVINAAPARGDEAENALTVARQFDNLTVLDTVIHERSVYRQAAMTGRAISEISPSDAKAVAELHELYGALFDDNAETNVGKAS